MTLSELIKIDNRFEKSVNLLLDLHSQKKVDSYIPTHSSINILGEYIHSVQQYSGNRASVLIGPYGKGKSHLLLILLAILAKDEDINVSDLLTRIELVDARIAADIRQVTETMGPMLPVIVNSNGGSLNQDLLRALVKALNSAGLGDVVPDSHFTEAVKVIRQWKAKFPDTYTVFVDRLEMPADKFVRALKRFDEDALTTFKSLYPALTAGSAFNPFVDTAVIDIYRSVNRCLRTGHGYAGIFVVFDEFSKYIEGHSTARFSEDMKVLQDLCELCNASKDEQMHLVCVAHKSIKSYGSTLPETVLNAFKGVEGRLKETQFVVSSQNNYELISDAIQKTAAFYTWSRHSEQFAQITQQSYEHKSFSSLFNPDDYQNIVADGCFPLTPVAATLLLSLSEKIAQNERTIFTYITSKDTASLSRAISKCKEPCYIGAASIYDYFESLFADEPQNSIHHEWLKADYALSMTDQRNEQIIIKTIAIIRMVNKPDELIASDKYLQLASGLSERDYQKAIHGLTGKKLIELRSRTSAYEFKNNVGVDVEVAISDCVAKRFSKADIGVVLCDVYQQKSILPKKHNQEHRMTRYFNTMFLRADQLLAMKDTSYLNWPNDPDGIVVFLMPEPNLNFEMIQSHVERIRGKSVIVCPPKQLESCDGLAQKLLAVRHLASDTNFIDANLVIRKELGNIEEDYIAELNKWVESTYFPLGSVYTSLGTRNADVLGINRLVSDLCDDIYTCTPLINNELINRHIVLGQIAKARSNIMMEMLGSNHVNAYLEGTSAEATIYRAIFVNNSTDPGIALVRENIQRFIQDSEQQKLPISRLIDTLTSPPYGMRKGPLPIILLDAILKQPGMPVISLGNKEVILDADVVTNMVKSPGDYYIQVEQETAQVGRYLNNLMNLFSDYNEYCQEVDAHNQMAKLVCVMQSWYRSLPQTSSTFITPDRPGQDIKQLTAFRKIFAGLYLNPRQILFEKIPDIFGTDNLDAAYEAVKNARQSIDEHIGIIRKQAVTTLRAAFVMEQDTNLARALGAWYGGLPESTRNRVMDTATANITSAITGIKSGDEELIAANLLYAVTGTFIEDLKTDTLEIFRTGLETYIHTMECSDTETSGHANKLTFLENGKQVELFYTYDSDTISPTATFFKSALDDMLEEYDTLEPSEKIGVLMDAVKNLMSQGD